MLKLCLLIFAAVAELADAPDLGSGVNDVGVQVPSAAPNKNLKVDRNLEVLLFISVSKKPFACAVFGIHRVKVLLCDNDFSLSAAHFLY